ncbi:FAD:protein FMN transferase [Agitococcus lubricus]|uniref:FAD:protein FMN transferase n=1 Tax=Agitococcus lubricus TaxID=1077255 RepID=A0A2T5J074_9GAMM|nr:FAD:protein FMN transferase [Agitococcus lubricus]PTQ89750.1 thiamine biosynthesis lipoprotein [Agitococcus lubricus]
MRSLLIALLSLSVVSCSTAPKEPVSFSGVAYYSMPWAAKIDTLPSQVNAQQLQQELQVSLDKANKVLSTYQNDTELMKFNRSPIGQWQQLSPMLLNSIQTSLTVSAATQGVYDVTVGALVDLWGFGKQAVPTHTPSQAEINQARQKVGWQSVLLNLQTHQAQRQKEVFLNLSSLGEGVGVDELEKVLAKYQVNSYMLSVAGTLKTQGLKPNGQTWQIAVEKPDGSGLPERILALGQQQTVVSTSGSYRNYHEIDGVRYSHTIDPRTAKPIQHKTVSTTVVFNHQKAAYADAWATALNALGAEEGLPLAEQLHIAVYFLVKTETGFKEVYSTAFKPYIGVAPK